MLPWFMFILINLLWCTHTLVINCTNEHECKYNTLHCNEVSPKCNINCSGKQSCKDVHVYGHTDLYVICSGEHSCDNLTIHCGIGECVLSCLSDSCFQNTIHTEKYQSFECSGSCSINAIITTTLLSPTKNHIAAFITDPNTSPTIKQIDISTSNELKQDDNGVNNKENTLNLLDSLSHIIFLLLLLLIIILCLCLTHILKNKRKQEQQNIIEETLRKNPPRYSLDISVNANTDIQELSSCCNHQVINMQNEFKSNELDSIPEGDEKHNMEDIEN